MTDELADELTPRTLESFRRRLHASAERTEAIGEAPRVELDLAYGRASGTALGISLGSSVGSSPGGHQGEDADPRKSRLPGTSRYTQSELHSPQPCRRCGDVEVLRGDHPRAGRCPQCGRNV